MKNLRLPDPSRVRRRKLDAEIGRLTEAIAQGLISSAVIQRLKLAEAEVAALPRSTVVDLDTALAALPKRSADTGSWWRTSEMQSWAT